MVVGGVLGSIQTSIATTTNQHRRGLFPGGYGLTQTTHVQIWRPPPLQTETESEVGGPLHGRGEGENISTLTTFSHLNKTSVSEIRSTHPLVLKAFFPKISEKFFALIHSADMGRKKSVLTEQPAAERLTEKQAIYVENVLDGKSKTEAAELAGYAQTKSASHIIERSEDVKAALREARAELSSAAQLKRADMIEIMMDAISMARMMSDPNGMISGAREIGKMLGLYAPEEKNVNLSVNQQRLRTQYEGMTDEELLSVIEGQYTRVEE